MNRRRKPAWYYRLVNQRRQHAWLMRGDPTLAEAQRRARSLGWTLRFRVEPTGAEQATDG